MKKIFILLFACTLTMQAAFAVRTAYLTRFLESETANQMIARLSSRALSTERIARLSLAEKEAILESSYFQAKGASMMGRILKRSTSETTKKGIREIFQRDSSMPDYLYKIKDGLELALTNGDVDAFRENMLALLYLPYRYIRNMGLVSILPQDFGKRMYEHPDRSFRRELYDLLNTLANKELVKLPREHQSIYQQHIPKLYFDYTDLGKAVRSNDMHKFFELSSTETFKDFLAHLNAVGIRDRGNDINTLDPVFSLPATFKVKTWEAYSRKEMLSKEIQKEIKRSSISIGNGFDTLGGLIVLSGGVAGLAFGADTWVQTLPPSANTPESIAYAGALGAGFGTAGGIIVARLVSLLRREVLKRSLNKGLENQQDR